MISRLVENANAMTCKMCLSTMFLLLSCVFNCLLLTVGFLNSDTILHVLVSQVLHKTSFRCILIFSFLFFFFQSKLCIGLWSEKRKRGSLHNLIGGRKLAKDMYRRVIRESNFGFSRSGIHQFLKQMKKLKGAWHEN